jgi:eukaryotic-like serine/threonine-protein kinase
VYPGAVERLAAGNHLGPYEIVARIGSGATGDVYRARDRRLDRFVAIKVLARSDVLDGDGLARFEREARAIAAVSHPNVVAIFDVGLGEVPFLVTELLDGETLRAAVQRGPLPLPRTLALIGQIAAGLDAAHAHGIVHRDLKPENIFVTHDDRVKILDFGLAKRIEPFGASDRSDASTTHAQTTGGAVLGTFGYMSPEQACGRAVDHRADIFACGVILFEMLTGQRAFRRESPAETISAILTEPASALAFPRDTPPPLQAIVCRCLEKSPADRLPSARDLASAIESIASARDPYGARPPRSPRAEVRSIAVLPFANASADPANEYFSDGLADELIVALTKLEGLRVVSRTSSFRYRDRDTDIRGIGRDLGVDAILEGRVRRAGSRLRLAVQLTNAADGCHIWSERYDRELADVFDIQDEMVEAIVAALAPALLPDATHGVQRRRPTENLEAYELYLKGRHFWSQRSPTVMGTAIRCFEQAIELDGRYALAYAGLADCYSILYSYGWTPRDHGQRRALEAVTQALALDVQLPEAHFAKALYVFHFERHWRPARTHFLDAIAASPRTAMFEAYAGLFCAAEYAYAEARAHLDRALDLEPHSAVVHLHAASASCVMGDTAAAERHARRALTLQPEALGPRWPLTIALAIAGRVDDAATTAEELVARSRAPMYLGVLGLAYGLAGRRAEAERLLHELDERQSRGEYIVPLARLAVALGLHDFDTVYTALAMCTDGGAAPSSVIVLVRGLIETCRGAPDITPLLDRLHDGATPDVQHRG